MELVTEPLLALGLSLSKLMSEPSVSIVRNCQVSEGHSHFIASVMMAALWSELNLILSVFFPFLNVMMNSLLGCDAWKEKKLYKSINF